MKNAPIIFAVAVLILPETGFAQSFQNLDFENGTFIVIPGDPYGSVSFVPAMPGWTGYVGTNQVDRLLHNSLFLDTAGIAIWGPNSAPGNPTPGIFNGQYFVVLQTGNDPFGGTTRVGSAISQMGTIPLAAQSLRLFAAFGVITASFASQQIPLSFLGSSPGGANIYGGDISAFAGQTGELRFQGAGYLDNIQFSNQPIPEPSGLALFGVGVLLVGFFRRRNSSR